MDGQAEPTWRCGVCGYVHRQAEPPKWCPVCGAAREEFRPYPPPTATAHPPPERWKCLNCGYWHTATRPPSECLVCSAPPDRFEPLGKSDGEFATRAEAKKVVVVGAGIAGVAAVEPLRATSPSTEITLISNGAELPYYRLNLTRYLAGEINEAALPIPPESWYAEQGIRLLRGAKSLRFRSASKSSAYATARTSPSRG